MRKGLRWFAAFVIMSLLGIGVATTTSGYISALVNPSQFSYVGSEYLETTYELSTDMEHKTNATYLYDFSGHSPSRDLKIPDTSVGTAGIYGRCYQWVFPRNSPINGTDLGILSESLTIEAWLNPRSLDNIIGWAGISESRRLLVATNGSALAQMTQPTNDFFSSVALGVGSWTHVAFVYDSDAGKISWIINGTLDRTSQQGYFSSWNGPFKIGGWTDSEIYRWNGKIDEFRIRHTPLTASEIADDMNRPIRKIVRITGLTPNTDKASLALEYGGIPQEVAADANGIADFDTFDYGDFFEGHFTIFHNDLTSRSPSLFLYTGDEYKFFFTSYYLSPTIVFVIIVIAFPLATAVAYVIKRATSKKPAGRE